MPDTETRTPVRVITGFLGSGKTTLLNYILSEPHNLGRIGVIENEYGEEGVDGKILAVKHDERTIIEVSNGCLCCTVRGDLKEAILDMLGQTPPVESIIVETSGVADPAPVVQTFLGDDDIAGKCVLKGVITLVDAKHVISHLDTDPQVGAQIASADVILLNKSDLVTNSWLQRVESMVKAINSHPDIIRCIKGKVDLSTLLSTTWFGKEIPEKTTDDKKPNKHGIAVTTITVPGALSLGDLELFLSRLTSEKSADLYRYKGVLPIKGHEQQRYIFQGVHGIFGGEIVPGGWPSDTPLTAKMVFIGKNLDKAELQKGLESCVAKDLRFKTGDLVQCSTPVGWQDGAILDTWNAGCPYLIEVISGIPNIPGRRLFAPADTESFVKSRG
eukprot:TRINITY_DN14776_c0_g1_i1.p1 TRINITY_DN14776_c0_g1~~TRINITY_DN14776_c0_g1_i1.p1  ORF type:complete len:387 (+),score=72.53 TRINITY_DN14776_c0_g1_i1:64-1224(+)